MKKRILFGAILIAAAAVLFWLDWRLEQCVRGKAGEGLAAPLIEIPEAGPLPRWPLPGLPLAVIVLVLTVLALGEVTRLAQSVGVQILGVSGLVGSVLLSTIPFWWQLGRAPGPIGQNLLPVLGFVILVTFAEQMIRSRTEDALRRIACTFLAVLYLGVGGAIVLSIRIEYGVPTLVLFLAAVKFTDIGAYFTGSALGRHKMITWLSPGKTWEGLVGGLVLGTGVSMAVVWLMRTAGARGAFGPDEPVSRLAIWQAGVFGVVVGLAGQFADLCESLLKRSAGAKDSGSAVPGFGGVLDILDSVLLGGPVALMLLRMMIV